MKDSGKISQLENKLDKLTLRSALKDKQVDMLLEDIYKGKKKIRKPKNLLSGYDIE